MSPFNLLFGDKNFIVLVNCAGPKYKMPNEKEINKMFGFFNLAPHE